MEITDEMMRRSARQEPFGTREPFISGNGNQVEAFHQRVFDALQRSRLIEVQRERDHHGSGYASYASAFLFKSHHASQQDFPTYVQTSGVLLYLSRLAPIAVFGANENTKSKDNKSSSSGFVESTNVGVLPNGDWNAFIHEVHKIMDIYNVELLSREPLLHPAPPDINIPTVFDGPYFVFDTLFYWED